MHACGLLRHSSNVCGSRSPLFYGRLEWDHSSTPALFLYSNKTSMQILQQRMRAGLVLQRATLALRASRRKYFLLRGALAA